MQDLFDHIEEDFFVTYGFVTRSLQALCIRARKPASPPTLLIPGQRSAGSGRSSSWISYENAARCTRARSTTIFSHGRVKNYRGGSSNATTHLLDAMHYRLRLSS